MPDKRKDEEKRNKRTLRDLIPDISKEIEEEPPDLIKVGEVEKVTSPPLTLTKKLLITALAVSIIVGLINIKFKTTLRGTASIIPWEVSVLNAKESGILKKLNKKHGDFVQEGELLGELENTAIIAQLNEEKEKINVKKQKLRQLDKRLENLEKKLNRKEKLYEKGAISLQELEDSRLQIELLKLDINAIRNELNICKSIAKELERRKESLKLYSIKSGFIVSKIEELIGTYIEQGDEICSIATLPPIVLELPLPENKLPLVRVGQKVKLTFTVQPDKTFEGEVVNLSPTLWTKRTAPRVEVNVISVIIRPVEGLPFPVRIGMTAKAEIITRKRSIFDIIKNRFF